MRSTHYKLKNREIPTDGFVNLEFIDIKKLFNNIKLPKPIEIPELNRRVIVGLDNGEYWSTVFTSDLEMKHVLCKWKVIKWQYDRHTNTTAGNIRCDTSGD